MKKLLYILCFIGLLFNYQSCTRPDVETYGSLYGVVADKTTGEPVASAWVELLPIGLKSVTGSEGQFEFTQLEPQNYTLYVTKAGYSDYTSNIVSVIADQIVKVDVPIEKLPPSLRVVNDKKEDIDSLNFGGTKADITRSFNIFNDGENALKWEITYTAEWIKSVSKSSDSLKAGDTQALVLTIDRSKLRPAENMTTLHITSDNGSKQLIITALGESTPRVILVNVSNAELMDFEGKMEFEGSPAYTEAGFVYGTTPQPTVEANKVACLVSIDSTFHYRSNRFLKNTTYYVRAYAINEVGIAYSSNEISFMTVEEATKVITDPVSDIEVTDGNGKAVFNATMPNVGKPRFSERGFCYTDNSDPIASYVEYGYGDVIKSDDIRENTYSVVVGNLQASRTYYVRAYAKQNDGYVYGDMVMFSTNTTVAAVTTTAASDITYTGATLNAFVSTEGTPAYTERGFCYATHSSPTITDTKRIVSGNGVGDYSLTISDLEHQTQYYVCAYVIQSGEPIYGNQITFTTTWVEPHVVMSAPTDVTATQATLIANVYVEGDPAYTERGFCYALHSSPTIADNKCPVSGNGVGEFSYTLHGLEPLTTYYALAYVIQNGEPVYAINVIPFQTILNTASVQTLQVTNVASETATLQGNVLAAGDPKYWERGFCYATHSDPTIETGDIAEEVSSVTGKYTMTISGLQSGQTYYVRAFVRQENEIIYGQVVSFQTTEAPVVYTSSVTDIKGVDIGLGTYLEYTVQFNGTVQNAGTPSYSQRGFVYSTYSEPTVSNGTKVVVPGTGVGSFSATATVQHSSYHYYVCAFVRVGKEYVYGNVVQFDVSM